MTNIKKKKKPTPDVMTTDWNLLKTGLMAIEASIQLKYNTGLDMVGVLSSKGSIIRTKPEKKTQKLKKKKH